MQIQFDFGTVMFAGYDADGHPVVQPDVLGSEPGVDPSETHHFFGFMGLPFDPVLAADGRPIPNESGSLMYARSGDDIHVFPLENTRLVTKIPRLKNGGSVQYGGKPARPAFSMIDGATGSYTLYVPYAFNGDTPGKAHTINVDVRGGSESVAIVHGDGMAVTLYQDSVVIKNASGSVYLEVSGSKVTINGDLQINGSLQFGGAAGAVPLLLAGMVPATMAKGV